MTQFELEALESIETPSQQDYSEDQEASCVILSCDKEQKKKLTA